MWVINSKVLSLKVEIWSPSVRKGTCGTIRLEERAGIWSGHKFQMCIVMQAQIPSREDVSAVVQAETGAAAALRAGFKDVVR